MESSTANQVTTPGNQNFFLSPQFPIQRQYEALRAYLVDEEPSADVARRFGYSPGFFRVLCYQFRHDPQKRASFFRLPQRGPQSSPARDRVRDLAVAMRKRNLSVYDMQRELAAAGHTISINSLTVLLREEGFSRLPRRADDERPVTVKPEIADVADVRRLDLAPCSFRTPLAGLFLLGVRRKSDGSGGDCAMPPFPEVLRSTTEMAATEGDNGVGTLECPMHTGAF